MNNMSKKLAIRGHEKRGDEVINILKMLGGTNYNAAFGNNDETYYFIDGEGIIDYDCTLNKDDNYLVFSIEEFLAKYPFKVGDKVVDIDDGDIGIITTMKWNEDVCDMGYRVTFGSGQWDWFTNDTIKFYQPENSKDIATTVNETQPKRDIYASEFMITHMLLPETPYNVNNELEYKIIDGYEFDRIENDKIILKVVKHKYPTTYEECCKVLGYDDRETYCICHTGTNERLFENLYHLKVCRDAYWKIAGEELGLGKPWEPDWNTSVSKYVIACTSNGIEKQWETTYCKCLAFPTAEMRDVFYENFKDLIEECKELL